MVTVVKPPRRILVVVIQRIGDVLLTTPLIRSMRRAWPAAEINVLTHERTDGFLRENPDVNHVITVPRAIGFWKRKRLALKLFRRFDLAVSTLVGDSSTICAWVAGRYRVGLLSENDPRRWKRRLLSRWVPFDEFTHQVLMNLKLADLLGIDRCYEVVVAWNRSDEQFVTQISTFDLSEPFAILHLYPKFAYKQWHQDGWVKLAQWLDRQGIRAVLEGGSSTDEQSYVEQVLDRLPKTAANLVGKLSLSQIAFLTSRARLFVGPDTANTHMAAALGIPTVALFGPSNPVKWGPWPKGYAQGRNPYVVRGSQRVGNVYLIQGEGDCVPCLQEGCERHIASRSDCLQNLSTHRVIRAVQAMLQGRASDDS